MKRIEISVQNRVAWQTNSVDYICGNGDFVIGFVFDSEWSEYETKTARLIYNGEHTDIVFTGTECKIPKILGAKRMEVGVYAGDLYTTTPALVHCRKSILCDSGAPADPAPDVYAQIMEKLNEQGKGTVTEEQIAQAVEDYFTEHPNSGGNVSWNDITDKPFEDAEVVVCYDNPNMQLDDFCEYTEILKKDFLIPGETYEVECKGVPYILECFAFDSVTNRLEASNLIISTERSPDNSIEMLVGTLGIADEYEVISLKVSHRKSIKKLDSKYLPMEEIVEAVAEALPGSGGNVDIVFDYLTEEVEYEIPCTDITLNKSALTFNGTGQQTIIATVAPVDTTDTVKWVSNNPTIASVAYGVVTAHADGSATITATCGEYSASCTVEVSGVSGSDTVAVTGITLNQNTASVQEGSDITLTATVKPDNASNKTVLWSSNNTAVATVVGGVVTGISSGSATIIATTADGGFVAECNVTVAAASNYRNLFDMNTMVTANQSLVGDGTIGNHNWGLARVPVKENTVYSLKKKSDGDSHATLYTAVKAGAIGFADQTGNTVISHLSFTTTMEHYESGRADANALLTDYAHMSGDIPLWVTFTTPTGCAYLLFNSNLGCTADTIQVEEGDTIHNYYLPYVGGES